MHPYIAADNGFPLLRNMLVPFSGELCQQTERMRVFNKLFSSGRTFSEQCWGILVNRFRMLYSVMGFKGPDYAVRVYKVVRCCMILHNLLRRMGEPDMGSDHVPQRAVVRMHAPPHLPSGSSVRDALSQWAVRQYELDCTGALRARRCR